MSIQIAVAAIVVLAIIILVAFAVAAHAAAKRYTHYLAGMWKGNPKFLEEAGLQDFQLFLSPGEAKQGYGRDGYLIATDATGGFVANQAITWEESGAGWLAALGASMGAQRDVCAMGVARIEYDDDATGHKIMPESVKVSLSILDGTLTLFDDEKVYAFLEKDHSASAAATEMYEAT
jgi:hypothetical protein